MHRPAVLHVLLVILALSAGARPEAISAQATERTRVVILHDNDTHFHDNHRASVARYLDEVRRSGTDVFLVSAGDALVRAPDRWPDGEGLEWYRTQGMGMFERMNEFGYDVMAMGNHELDVRGMVTREILDSARFPIITANIRTETELLPPLRPYHILRTTSGISLAVLGLTVINFDPADRMEELDYEETVRRYLHLADEHDAILLLTHIGIRYDLELANAVPEIAAIIGGHTNTLLPEAIHVNGVLVAHAGGHGHFRDHEREMFMGVIVLEFEGRELVETCGRVMRIGPAGVRPAGAWSGQTGGSALMTACSLP